MGIFDSNTDKDNADELLYEAIKEELKPLLEKFDENCGKIAEGSEVYWINPKRSKVINETANMVLQFIWRKMGKKIPIYSKNVLDSDFNIMYFKN